MEGKTTESLMEASSTEQEGRAQNEAVFLTIGGLPRTCMSCFHRPATRQLLNSKGRKQYRCEVCFTRNNASGFKRRK